MSTGNSLEISHSMYAIIAAFIFLSVSVLHGLRAFYGWDLTLNQWAVPVSYSWFISVITFIMAITAIKKL